MLTLDLSYAPPDFTETGRATGAALGDVKTITHGTVGFRNSFGDRGRWAVMPATMASVPSGNPYLTASPRLAPHSSLILYVNHPAFAAAAMSWNIPSHSSWPISIRPKKRSMNAPSVARNANRA